MLVYLDYPFTRAIEWSSHHIYIASAAEPTFFAKKNVRGNTFFRHKKDNKILDEKESGQVLNTYRPGVSAREC